MRRPTATATASVLALSGLLLLTGCSGDGGAVTDLPTAGDVTGDTSGTAPATPSETATTE